MIETPGNQGLYYVSHNFKTQKAPWNSFGNKIFYPLNFSMTKLTGHSADVGILEHRCCSQWCGRIGSRRRRPGSSPRKKAWDIWKQGRGRGRKSHALCELGHGPAALGANFEPGWECTENTQEEVRTRAWASLEEVVTLECQACTGQIRTGGEHLARWIFSFLFSYSFLFWLCVLFICIYFH